MWKLTLDRFIDWLNWCREDQGWLSLITLLHINFFLNYEYYIIKCNILYRAYLLQKYQILKKRNNLGKELFFKILMKKKSMVTGPGFHRRVDCHSLWGWFDGTLNDNNIQITLLIFNAIFLWIHQFISYLTN